MTEQNLYSLFRVLGDDLEDPRKVATEQNA